MQAKDVMTTNVISVDVETTVREACQLLLEKGITGLPVVNQEGQLVGMITEFGLMEALHNPNIRNDPIRDTMTRDVLTVDENEPIVHVVSLFLLHRIRRLPVVRNADMDGRIVGMISRRDLMRIIVDSKEEITDAPPPTEAHPMLAP